MNKTFISQLQGGKYQVNSLIGSGGFGNTYLATQVTLGRKVAIKEFFMKEFCERDESTSQVIIPTEGSRLIVDRYRQKFLKEAQMIASLRNEHIIKIYDIFEENNTAYYVMDYIEGGSLNDAVDSKGPLSESKAVGYIQQISDALSYLHSNNILHLDIKPSNVLIDKDDCLVLIDFGISKHYDSDGGQTSTTPAGISKGYAPIEQYQQGSIANFSPATDVYSLGATMFFLLTGKTPPEASIVNEDGLPNDIDGFTHNIRSVIIKSMSPRRKDRYQSVEEFKSAIVFKSTETSESKKTLSNSSEDTILLTEKLDIPSPDMATHLNRSEDSRKNISNQISNDWNKKKHGLIIKLVIIFALSMVGLSYYIVSDIKDKEAKAINQQRERIHQEYMSLINQGDDFLLKEDYASAINCYEHAQKIEQQYSNTPYYTEFNEGAAEKIETVIQAQTYNRTHGQVNGHEWVDLGLSVKWGVCNIGASSISDYGDYFAWAETKTKTIFRYVNSVSYGQKFNDINGDVHYDVASAIWGKPWRLPTRQEQDELNNNCSWTWTTCNNINGYQIIGPNGNSIFLPAAGYYHMSKLESIGIQGNYWSSTPWEEFDHDAYRIAFAETYHSVDFMGRFYGFSIRAVCD